MVGLLSAPPTSAPACAPGATRRGGAPRWPAARSSSPRARPAIEVFDTPYFEYRDEAGLERSARRARALGFDGKTCIHPGQVAVVNRVFAPTREEVERAADVVAALEAAAREGRGVATVDGEMVEALHAAEARRTLDRAARAGTSWNGRGTADPSRAGRMAAGSG